MQKFSCFFSCPFLVTYVRKSEQFTFEMQKPNILHFIFLSENPSLLCLSRIFGNKVCIFLKKKLFRNTLYLFPSELLLFFFFFDRFSDSQVGYGLSMENVYLQAFVSLHCLFHDYCNFFVKCRTCNDVIKALQQPLSISAFWSADILWFGLFFLKAFLGGGAWFGRCAKTTIPHSHPISPLECCLSPKHFELCKYHIM